MSNTINKIASVEIKALWGRYDLKWDMNPDVNILSGLNGSGKSTILESIVKLIKGYDFSSKVINKVERIVVTFDNGKNISYEFMGTNFGQLNPSRGGVDINSSLGEKLTLNIDIISTFDNEIPDIGRKPDENVKTELDRDIFKLQKLYLDYQLNIGKKKDLAIENEEKPREAVEKIKYPQNRFLDIIDFLFSETDKKINRAKNEIVFNIGEQEITPYQLSSGEKQILVILLTVLVQDNKPSIIFMDEPEISLHFDWQKKLIGYILELNPNVQIILATHSPGLVLEGWRDKVKEVRDLIVFDKLAPKK